MKSKNYLSLILSLMLAIGLVNTAYSALPVAAQADLLNSKISKALKAKNYADADKLFQQYDALEAKIPTPLIFQRAIVSYHLKKYLAAQQALEQYLNKAERGSKSYKKALAMYQDVEPLAEPELKAIADAKVIADAKAKAKKAKAIAVAKAAAEAEARRKVEARRAYLAGDGSVPPEVASDYTNSIGMVFKNIPAGKFYMGSKSGNSDELPRHKVRISKKFQMGVFEVTVGQFKQFIVAGGQLSEYSSLHNDSNNKPVADVSWNDAQDFISWLNKKEGGNAYRFPTEAEWEYAARAGTKTQFSWGNSESQADAYAWYEDNSGGGTHAVGGKKANPWGLYDMHGNVWEWVGDWYAGDYYKNSPKMDPHGPTSGGGRVFRGGGWLSDARSLRSANRSLISPGNRLYDLGFRLVRQP